MADYTENKGSYNGIAVGGLVTGIVGSLLGVTNSNWGGLLGGNNQYVTREELNMTRDLAYKDSQIAILTSENNTNTKLVDVFERLSKNINDNYKEQQAWNASQSVINAQMSSAIAVNNSSITSIKGILDGLTKTVIPITNVCPQPAVATTQTTG